MGEGGFTGFSLWSPARYASVRRIEVVIGMVLLLSFLVH